MARIRILHVTEHPDLWNIACEFPVEVEAREVIYPDGGEFGGYYVKGSELLRIGADELLVGPDDEYFFSNFPDPRCPNEYEEVEE